MIDYYIETEYRKFVNRAADFSFAETIISSYDLKMASKKYKFNLVPKVASELDVVGTVELMSTDEEAYRLWTKTIAKIIKAQEDILRLTSDGAKSKSANLSSVELVVEAAIKSRNV